MLNYILSSLTTGIPPHSYSAALVLPAQSMFLTVCGCGGGSRIAAARKTCRACMVGTPPLPSGSPPPRPHGAPPGCSVLEDWYFGSKQGSEWPVGSYIVSPKSSPSGTTPPPAEKREAEALHAPSKMTGICGLCNRDMLYSKGPT